MFRSKIINLTIYRNISPKDGVLISINRRSISNLKEQNYNSVINNIYNENDEITTNKGVKTIFSIQFNKNPPNLNNNNNNNDSESGIRDFSSQSKAQHFSRSMNNSFTKYNILNKSTTLLLSHNSLINKSCINSVGVRHLSSNAVQGVQIPQLTGIWKDMSESAPVLFVQENLISFQSITNLPWWATVILTTFVVRSTMTFPLSLYQHYIFAKVQNLQIQMNDIVKQLKVDANTAVSHFKWSEDYARSVYNASLKRKWDELIQKENCHPAKGFIVVWTQLPLWITISAALRNFCYMLPPWHEDAGRIYLELAAGGFGWVPSLIDVDHYWILPVSVGIFNLANIEIMRLMKIKEDTRFQKYILYFFRTISIAMVPIATCVPSCICLYWASSSAFGLIQNLVLLSPKVRRLCGVPLTATEKANPYRYLVEKFKTTKYFNFGRRSDSSN